MIREFITVDPISAERMDLAGSIHRYNFGWIKTVRSVTVAGKEKPQEPGEPDDPGDDKKLTTETSDTQISGFSKKLSETVVQEVLPPSLTVPEVIPSTTMHDGYELTTYARKGTKKRLITRVRPFGTSKLIPLGDFPFAVIEDKEYADAISGAETPVVAPDSSIADGGVTVSIANGIKTYTTIKG